jgi:hypothetical protein
MDTSDAALLLPCPHYFVGGRTVRQTSVTNCIIIQPWLQLLSLVTASHINAGSLTFRTNARVMFKTSMPWRAQKKSVNSQFVTTISPTDTGKISSLALNLAPFDTSVEHFHSTPLHLPDALRHLLT